MVYGAEKVMKPRRAEECLCLTDAGAFPTMKQLKWVWNKKWAKKTVSFSSFPSSVISIAAWSSEANACKMMYDRNDNDDSTRF